MDQQSRSFMPTTEAKECPYDIKVKIVEYPSSKRKHIKRDKTNRNRIAKF